MGDRSRDTNNGNSDIRNNRNNNSNNIPPRNVHAIPPAPSQPTVASVAHPFYAQLAHLQLQQQMYHPHQNVLFPTMYNHPSLGLITVPLNSQNVDQQTAAANTWYQMAACQPGLQDLSTVQHPGFSRFPGPAFVQNPYEFQGMNIAGGLNFAGAFPGAGFQGLAHQPHATGFVSVNGHQSGLPRASGVTRANSGLLSGHTNASSLQSSSDNSRTSCPRSAVGGLPNLLTGFGGLQSVRDIPNASGFQSVSYAQNISSLRSHSTGNILNANGHKCVGNIQSAASVQNVTNVQSTQTSSGPQIVGNIQTVNTLQSAGNIQSARGLPSVSGILTVSGLQSAGNIQTASGLQSAGKIKTASGLPSVNSIQTVSGLQSTGNIQTGICLQSTGNIRTAGSLPRVLSIQTASGSQSAGNIQTAGGLQSAGNIQTASGLPHVLSIQTASGPQSAGTIQTATGLQNAGNIQTATSLQSARNIQTASALQTVVNSTVIAVSSHTNTTSGDFSVVSQRPQTERLPTGSPLCGRRHEPQRSLEKNSSLVLDTRRQPEMTRVTGLQAGGRQKDIFPPSNHQRENEGSQTLVPREHVGQTISSPALGSRQEHEKTFNPLRPRGPCGPRPTGTSGPQRVKTGPYEHDGQRNSSPAFGSLEESEKPLVTASLEGRRENSPTVLCRSLETEGSQNSVPHEHDRHRTSSPALVAQREPACLTHETEKSLESQLLEQRQKTHHQYCGPRLETAEIFESSPSERGEHAGRPLISVSQLDDSKPFKPCPNSNPSSSSTRSGSSAPSPCFGFRSISCDPRPNHSGSGSSNCFTPSDPSPCFGFRPLSIDVSSASSGPSSSNCANPNDFHPSSPGPSGHQSPGNLCPNSGDPRPGSCDSFVINGPNEQCENGGHPTSSDLRPGSTDSYSDSNRASPTDLFPSDGGRPSSTSIRPGYRDSKSNSSKPCSGPIGPCESSVGCPSSSDPHQNSTDLLGSTDLCPSSIGRCPGSSDASSSGPPTSSHSSSSSGHQPASGNFHTSSTDLRPSSNMCPDSCDNPINLCSHRPPRNCAESGVSMKESNCNGLSTLNGQSFCDRQTSSSPLSDLPSNAPSSISSEPTKISTSGCQAATTDPPPSSGRLPVSSGPLTYGDHTTSSGSAAYSGLPRLGPSSLGQDSPPKAEPLQGVTKAEPPQGVTKAEPLQGVTCTQAADRIQTETGTFGGQVDTQLVPSDKSEAQPLPAADSVQNAGSNVQMQIGQGSYQASSRHLQQQQTSTGQLQQHQPLTTQTRQPPPSGQPQNQQTTGGLQQHESENEQLHLSYTGQLQRQVSTGQLQLSEPFTGPQQDHKPSSGQLTYQTPTGQQQQHQFYSELLEQLDSSAKPRQQHQPCLGQHQTPTKQLEQHEPTLGEQLEHLPPTRQLHKYQSFSRQNQTPTKQLEQHQPCLGQLLQNQPSKGQLQTEQERSSGQLKPQTLTKQQQQHKPCSGQYQSPTKQLEQHQTPTEQQHQHQTPTGKELQQHRPCSGQLKQHQSPAKQLKLDQPSSTGQQKQSQPSITSTHTLPPSQVCEERYAHEKDRKVQKKSLKDTPNTRDRNAQAAVWPVQYSRISSPLPQSKAPSLPESSQYQNAEGLDLSRTVPVEYLDPFVPTPPSTQLRGDRREDKTVNPEVFPHFHSSTAMQYVPRYSQSRMESADCRSGLQQSFNDDRGRPSSTVTSFSSSSSSTAASSRGAVSSQITSSGDTRRTVAILSNIKGPLIMNPVPEKLPFEMGVHSSADTQWPSISMQSAPVQQSVSNVWSQQEFPKSSVDKGPLSEEKDKPFMFKDAAGRRQSTHAEAACTDKPLLTPNTLTAPQRHDKSLDSSQPVRAEQAIPAQVMMETEIPPSGDLCHPQITLVTATNLSLNSMPKSYTNASHKAKVTDDCLATETVGEPCETASDLFVNCSPEISLATVNDLPGEQSTDRWDRCDSNKPSGSGESGAWQTEHCGEPRVIRSNATQPDLSSSSSKTSPETRLQLDQPAMTSSQRNAVGTCLQQNLERQPQYVRDSSSRTQCAATQNVSGDSSQTQEAGQIQSDSRNPLCAQVDVAAQVVSNNTLETFVASVQSLFNSFMPATPSRQLRRRQCDHETVNASHSPKELTSVTLAPNSDTVTVTQAGKTIPVQCDSNNHPVTRSPGLYQAASSSTCHEKPSAAMQNISGTTVKNLEAATHNFGGSSNSAQKMTHVPSQPVSGNATTTQAYQSIPAEIVSSNDTKTKKPGQIQAASSSPSHEKPCAAINSDTAQTLLALARSSNDTQPQPGQIQAPSRSSSLEKPCAAINSDTAQTLLALARSSNDTKPQPGQIQAPSRSSSLEKPCATNSSNTAHTLLALARSDNRVDPPQIMACTSLQPLSGHIQVFPDGQSQPVFDGTSHASDLPCLEAKKQEMAVQVSTLSPPRAGLDAHLSVRQGPILVEKVSNRCPSPPGALSNTTISTSPSAPENRGPDDVYKKSTQQSCTSSVGRHNSPSGWLQAYASPDFKRIVAAPRLSRPRKVGPATTLSAAPPSKRKLKSPKLLSNPKSTKLSSPGFGGLSTLPSMMQHKQSPNRPPLSDNTKALYSISNDPPSVLNRKLKSPKLLSNYKCSKLSRPRLGSLSTSSSTRKPKQSANCPPLIRNSKPSACSSGDQAAPFKRKLKSPRLPSKPTHGRLSPHSSGSQSTSPSMRKHNPLTPGGTPVPTSTETSTSQKDRQFPDRPPLHEYSEAPTDTQTFTACTREQLDSSKVEKHLLSRPDLVTPVCNHLHKTLKAWPSTSEQRPKYTGQMNKETHRAKQELLSAQDSSQHSGAIQYTDSSTSSAPSDQRSGLFSGTTSVEEQAYGDVDQGQSTEWVPLEIFHSFDPDEPSTNLNRVVSRDEKDSDANSTEFVHRFIEDETDSTRNKTQNAQSTLETSLTLLCLQRPPRNCAEGDVSIKEPKEPQRAGVFPQPYTPPTENEPRTSPTRSNSPPDLRNSRYSPTSQFPASNTDREMPVLSPHPSDCVLKKMMIASDCVKQLIALAEKSRNILAPRTWRKKTETTDMPTLISLSRYRAVQTESGSAGGLQKTPDCSHYIQAASSEPGSKRSDIAQKHVLCNNGTHTDNLLSAIDWHITELYRTLFKVTRRTRSAYKALPHLRQEFHDIVGKCWESIIAVTDHETKHVSVGEKGVPGGNGTKGVENQPSADPVSFTAFSAEIAECTGVKVVESESRMETKVKAETADKKAAASETACEIIGSDETTAPTNLSGGPNGPSAQLRGGSSHAELDVCLRGGSSHAELDVCFAYPRTEESDQEVVNSENQTTKTSTSWDGTDSQPQSSKKSTDTALIIHEISSEDSTDEELPQILIGGLMGEANEFWDDEHDMITYVLSADELRNDSQTATYPNQCDKELDISVDSVTISDFQNSFYPNETFSQLTHFESYEDINDSQENSYLQMCASPQVNISGSQETSNHEKSSPPKDSLLDSEKTTNVQNPPAQSNKGLSRCLKSIAITPCCSEPKNCSKPKEVASDFKESSDFKRNLDTRVNSVNPQENFHPQRSDELQKNTPASRENATAFAVAFSCESEDSENKVPSSNPASQKTEKLTMPRTMSTQAFIRELQPVFDLFGRAADCHMMWHNHSLRRPGYMDQKGELERLLKEVLDCFLLEQSLDT